MKYAQSVECLNDGSFVIADDWYPGRLPANMKADDMVYFDTSYSFRSFYSKQPVGIEFGYASGNYGRSIITTDEKGVIKIGRYVILEATSLVCSHSITIGDHCMFSWGSVVTDSWLDEQLYSPAARNKILQEASLSGQRYPKFKSQKPIVIEDNCWVGFDAVILPGVRLGRGCVVGCKTVIETDVPPYAVVAGSPPRIVRYLQPTDTEEARAQALQEYLKQ